MIEKSTPQMPFILSTFFLADGEWRNPIITLKDAEPVRVRAFVDDFVTKCRPIGMMVQLSSRVNIHSSWLEVRLLRAGEVAWDLLRDRPTDEEGWVDVRGLLGDVTFLEKDEDALLPHSEDLSEITMEIRRAGPSDAVVFVMVGCVLQIGGSEIEDDLQHDDGEWVVAPEQAPLGMDTRPVGEGSGRPVIPRHPLQVSGEQLVEVVSGDNAIGETYWFELDLDGLFSHGFEVRRLMGVLVNEEPPEPGWFSMLKDLHVVSTRAGVTSRSPNLLLSNTWVVGRDCAESNERLSGLRHYPTIGAGDVVRVGVSAFCGKSATGRVRVSIAAASDELSPEEVEAWLRGVNIGGAPASPSAETALGEGAASPSI